jgi:hypothetical protein
MQTVSSKHTEQYKCIIIMLNELITIVLLLETIRMHRRLFFN